MNLSLSGTGTIYTLAPSSSSSPIHQPLTPKRSHSTQPFLTASAADFRELKNAIQELNNHFKRNAKVLTEIKDQITKVCEKQETRLVDDVTGIHKLERVCIYKLEFISFQ